MKHNKDMNKNMNLHTCSVQLYIIQSFLLLLVLLLLCNFVVAITTLHITNANRSTTSGQPDICSQMYPAQMSYEKSSFS